MAASTRARSRVPAAIEALRPEHWPAVRAILEEGIAGGEATFETEAPSWEDWDRTHLPEHRFVAMERGEVVGWAALSPVSARAAYAGVAEVSVYVAERSRGRRVGTALLEALVRSSEEGRIWTLQAVLFPENATSVALHRRAGFRVVGRRERIGSVRGRWRDTLLLERRSEVAG